MTPIYRRLALLFAAVIAVALAAPAMAQDRVVPTKAPSQVSAALATVPVDPSTGAPLGSSASPYPTGNAQVTTTTATIANGASMSAAVDLGTARLARIAMPASWTAANITFQVSPDNVTYNDLYDSTGAEYTVTAAASRSIIVPLADFIGIRYLKVRSGTSASAVNQGGARTLTLVLVP